jgi:hypothetical protein
LQLPWSGRWVRPSPPTPRRSASQDGISIRRTTKTAGSTHLVAVVAGITSVGSKSLNDTIGRAVQAATVMDAAALIATDTASLLVPVLPRLVLTLGHGDVVWEALVAGWAEGSGAVPSAVKLTGYLDHGELRLEPQLVHARGPVPQCAVLGTRHEWLRRHDSAVAASLDLAADLARDPDAMRGVLVPDCSPETAHRLIVEALARQHLAEPPAWWPSGVPLATGPVTTAFIGR